jgi:hypothetical protein
MGFDSLQKTPKPPIITIRNRPVQPGDAFEDTAFKPRGLKLTNSKPSYGVSTLHITVK